MREVTKHISATLYLLPSDYLPHISLVGLNSCGRLRSDWTADISVLAPRLWLMDFIEKLKHH